MTAEDFFAKLDWMEPLPNFKQWRGFSGYLGPYTIWGNNGLFILDRPRQLDGFSRTYKTLDEAKQAAQFDWNYWQFCDLPKFSAWECYQNDWNWISRPGGKWRIDIGNDGLFKVSDNWNRYSEKLEGITCDTFASAKSLCLSLQDEINIHREFVRDHMFTDDYRQQMKMLGYEYETDA